MSSWVVLSLNLSSTMSRSCFRKLLHLFSKIVFHKWFHQNKTLVLAHKKASLVPCLLTFQKDTMDLWKNIVVMEYFIHETKWFGVSKSLFLLTVNEYKNTKAIQNCQSQILPYMKTSLGTIIRGWCRITHLPETALLRIPGILWASFKVKAEFPICKKNGFANWKGQDVIQMICKRRREVEK
jgi:hypothetical protein